ncbi:MAG: isoprenylcysteine carboxylmethyltransferase family protein [Acidobacteriota bacterium]
MPRIDRPSFAVQVPPPLWALLFLVAGWLSGRLLGLPSVVRAPMIGTMLIVAGIGLSAWGRRTFDRAGTEVMPTSPVNSVLVTHGPFAYTRNPMYLGILIVLAGFALCIGTLTAWAAVVVFFLWVNFVSVPYEEAKMERQYGERFREYTRRVRRWI